MTPHRKVWRLTRERLKEIIYDLECEVDLYKIALEEYRKKEQGKE
jgi:hypothetical protein